MAKFKPYSVGGEFKTQIDLNKCIPQDHLCKQMEKIVSSLDTDIIENNYSPIGQNAVHPKLLLSVIFYGYRVTRHELCYWYTEW